MSSHPVNAPKTGLGRRHDSQFSQQPSPSSATSNPNRSQLNNVQPRLPPQPSPLGDARYTNPNPIQRPNTNPTQHHPYPVQQKVRQPTPVVVEVDDDPVTAFEVTALMLPPQSRQRFDPTPYASNRNIPNGQQGPSARSATSGNPGQMRQNGPQGVTGRPHQSQPHQVRPQAPNQGGRPSGPAQRAQPGPPSREEAIRREFQRRLAAGEPTRTQAGQDGPGPTQRPHPNAGPRRGGYTGSRPPPPGLSGPGRQVPQARSALQDQNPIISSRKIDRPTQSSVSLGNKADDEAINFDAEGDVAIIKTGGSGLNAKVKEGSGVPGAERSNVQKGRVEKASATVIVKEKPIPKPVFNFNAALELIGPFQVAKSIDHIGIRKRRLTIMEAENDQREKAVDGEKKQLQWEVVSNVFDAQQQGLEGAMGFYNTLINRFNDLADLKNNNLQEKEDLTDRYRRAGATLSTQCVTLQSSTNQVRLTESKKRRLITDGRSASGLPGVGGGVGLRKDAGKQQGQSCEEVVSGSEEGQIEVCKTAEIPGIQAVKEVAREGEDQAEVYEEAGSQATKKEVQDAKEEEKVEDEEEEEVEELEEDEEEADRREVDQSL